MTTQPCPHCGTEMQRGNLTAHIPACPRNPVMRERIAAALADPDRPGYALASNVYEVVAQRQHIPQRFALAKMYGNWAAVCAAFGLKPLARRTGYRPPVLSEAKRLAALDAEVERMRQAAEPAGVYREWRGLECCSVREIDGGRRLAWMVR